MIIDVLVCNLDGSQHIEQREVPDDYYSPAQENAEAAVSSEQL